MSLTMSQASRPVLLRGLRALSAILAQGEAYAAEKGIDPASFVTMRLIDDMLPFTRQVQIASDAAKGAIARLAGVETPRFADDENDFATLQARIAKTIAFVESVPAEQIDGSEERAIVIKMPQKELHLVGRDFLFGFALPNFYFHISTAYALLRQKGVPLGKSVYLGEA